MSSARYILCADFAFYIVDQTGRLPEYYHTYAWLARLVHQTNSSASEIVVAYVYFRRYLDTRHIPLALGSTLAVMLWIAQDWVGDGQSMLVNFTSLCGLSQGGFHRHMAKVFAVFDYRAWVRPAEYRHALGQLRGWIRVDALRYRGILRHMPSPHGQLVPLEPQAEEALAARVEDSLCSFAHVAEDALTGFRDTTAQVVDHTGYWCCGRADPLAEASEEISDSSGDVPEEPPRCASEVFAYSPERSGYTAQQARYDEHSTDSERDYAAAYEEDSPCAHCCFPNR